VSDLLIRGGTVIDGTRAPARRADVRVQAGRIGEVGANLARQGERELDAGGAYVTPGFIDVHTHLDPTLCWDPLADPMPQHGITTVVTGNCSLSLAPVRSDERDGLSKLFCYIEDMPASSFATGIDWRWEDYKGYRDTLSWGGLGVNAASLIGHSALRLFVMGAEAWERSANDDERSELASILDASLRAGAFGLSLSFFDTDADSRPVPGRMADDAELAALIEVLAVHRAVLQAGPGPQSDLDRVLGLTAGRDVGVTSLGVFLKDRTDHTQQLLQRASDLQAQGVDFYPQFSPRTGNVTINWERTMAFMTFPLGWHRIIQAQEDDRRQLLSNPTWRSVARDEWDQVDGSIYPHKFPDRVRLVSTSGTGLERWVGLSMADLLAERSGHPSDVLADWLLENNLNPGLLAVGQDDPVEIASLLKHPSVIVGASDAGAHVGMICATGDSTLVLARHVRERGDLTLEDAVWQLSGRAAQVFRLPGRGSLIPGAAGDLAVFDLDELRWEDEVLVDDLPGGASRFRRPDGGYRYTVLAGEVTQEASQLTGARPGTVLDANRATSGP
jgi:N-acyl-D-amino-acid deacylase